MTREDEKRERVWRERADTHPGGRIPISVGHLNCSVELRERVGRDAAIYWRVYVHDLPWIGSIERERFACAEDALAALRSFAEE